MGKLIFGSEEWIEELNKRVKFPNMFSMYYGLHQETEESTIQVVIVETSSKNPKNIKYGSISPTLSMTLTPYRWLLEDVYYIENANDYLNILKKVINRWGVDFD